MNQLKPNLFFLFFLFFLFQSAQAQENILDKKITIEFKQLKLNDALRDIEKKLSIYFTFEASVINTERIVNQSFKSLPLRICLDQMFNDTNLVYKVIDNHIVIRQKPQLKTSGENVRIVPEFLTIKGFIIDSNNNDALAYANISVSGHNIGVVSNANGEFILKIPLEFSAETLCFSHLGYTNSCRLISELKTAKNVIKLERSYIPIQEVIIRKTDPRNIIRNVFKNIEKNYSLLPVYQTGFYRESVCKGTKFMFVSEAITQIYKSSYRNTFDDDMLKIIKSRKLQDLSMEDTVIVKLKSGLQASLELDLIKNRIEFLQEEYFAQYKYVMTDIVRIDDRDAYLIEFEPQEFAQEAYFEGKIYIDIKDLAIVLCEFQINQQKINHKQNQFIAKKKKGVRIKMQNIAYTVKYHRYGDTYHLNHVSGLMDMKVKKQGKLFPFNFNIRFEMTVNEVITENVERFKRRDAAKLHTIFFDEIYAYDEEFWEHYNFMMPDLHMKKAIEKTGSE